MTTSIAKDTWTLKGPNDLVNQKTKTIVVELVNDEEIHYTINYERVNKFTYDPSYKAGIDFHKIMEFIIKTLDKSSTPIYLSGRSKQ